MAKTLQVQVGQALVEFSSNGAFPTENDVSSAIATPSILLAAQKALDTAKTDLETEIRQISKDTAPDVESWITNAKALQADLDKCRKLANEIVRQAEVQERHPVQEQQAHVELLEKEVRFNAQLGEALLSIKEANTQLRLVDRLISENRILDCLRTLDDVYATTEAIPAPPQAVQLLYRSYSERKFQVFNHFKEIWQTLIKFDGVANTVQINAILQPTSLSDAVQVLQSYKKLPEFAVELWENIDLVILKPRMDIEKRYSIQTQEVFYPIKVILTSESAC